MRLLFLSCITILMFVTSLTTEEDIRNPEWATEGNKMEYAKVLNLSFLFFEAMRSGGLPEFHRIRWRGHSMLNDEGFHGEDLTGGYYNSGSSYVKYAFPTAFATTMLAWSVILWPETYRKSGDLNAAYSAIRWATEYFMRCHTTKDTLYVQLGSETEDSKYSGRPEDLSYSRQVYEADIKHPATDIASEIVAAFAAASIVFKDIFHDDPYSKKCFKHARKLYRFAVRYPGSHYSWMPDHYETYEENPLGYFDDLTWAALWLYKASKNNKYFRHAETYYWSLISRDDVHDHLTLFDYYSKLPGVVMMLATFSIDVEYENSVDEYIQELLHQHYRTKKGLIFLHEDPLPLAANAAFLCLVAASSGKDKTRQCYNIARHQIDFMLGLKESDRSYVVGYGRNPPTHIRHKAAACPSKPAPCGWKEQEADVPNPQVLYGALVSGPDANYHFNDTRRSNDSSKYTKVRIDYNAGFTGALVGLLQLHNTDYYG